MSNMKVKGTQRHNFDCGRVQKLLESGALDREDATRILGEALHVIGGLRQTVLRIGDNVEQLKHLSSDKTIWMKGEK